MENRIKKSQVLSTTLLILLLNLRKIDTTEEKTGILSDIISFTIGAPKYIEYFQNSFGSRMSFLIGTLISTISILVPIPFLDNIQRCIVGAIGFFLFAGHLLLRPIPASKNSYTLFFLMFALYIATAVSAFMSMNPKFNNLFLSSGASYVVVVITFGLFNWTNFYLCLIAYIFGLIFFVFLKKKAVNVHNILSKTLVLSFLLLMAIDVFIRPLKISESIFNTENFLSKAKKWMGLGIYTIIFVIVFFIVKFKSTIQKIFRLNK